MGSEMIPLLQLGIFFIFMIMVLLIAIYIYLMKPKTPKEKKEQEHIIESEEEGKKKFSILWNLTKLLII